jgi:hypothetical protein
MAEAVKWGKDRKEAFRSWFRHELQQTIGDRGALETKWRNHIIQWRARILGDGTGDVPFVGASDIELPLTAIHADPVVADFMQTLHVPPQFWSVVGKRPDTVDVAKPLQEFLSAVERNYIQMRLVNERILMDMILLGTAVYKDYILHERKTVKDYDEVGNITDVTKVKFQPRVQNVPLQDFYIPGYATEIDADAPINAAPWVAQRFRVREAEFKLKSESEDPFLPKYEKNATKIVENFVTDIRDNEVVETQRAEDEFLPYRDMKIELHEVWARYDVDGDGFEEDIVVVWHHPTGQILRTTYNPFMHGKRPFEAARYLPGFGFYGLGIAELDEWAQLAGTNILNSTVNNAFLSNAVMLGVPFGANVNPDEPIYPGKIWPLGPNEKIQDISIGRPNPQMYELLDRFMQWSEARTGVNELRQGNLTGLPSRTPASTVLSIMREGNKRFDMILGNLRQGALKRLGVKMLQNLVQISKLDPRWKAEAIAILGPEDGAKVAAILDGPVHEIESKFGVSVTATSSQVNQEVEKQNFIALSQTMQQMYGARFQFAQILAQMGQQEPMMQTALEGYNGSVELQRRMLEAYDIQNLDIFVSPASGGAQLPQQQQPGAAPQQGAAPAGAPPAIGGPQGAAPLAQGGDLLSALLGVQG